MNIIVRIYNKKGRVIGRRTGGKENWKKLYGKLASAYGHNRPYRWWVHVSYGHDKNVFGKRVLFKNEGEYYNAKDATRALQAFMGA